MVVCTGYNLLVWLLCLGFWFLKSKSFLGFNFVTSFAVTISDIVACPEEQILTDEQPDMDGCPGGENLDDEGGEAMVEEALSGTTIKQHPSVVVLALEEETVFSSEKFLFSIFR